jgi:hypothetical protein
MAHVRARPRAPSTVRVSSKRRYEYIADGNRGQPHVLNEDYVRVHHVHA